MLCISKPQWRMDVIHALCCKAQHLCLLRNTSWYTYPSGIWWYAAEIHLFCFCIYLLWKAETAGAFATYHQKSSDPVPQYFTLWWKTGVFESFTAWISVSQNKYQSFSAYFSWTSHKADHSSLCWGLRISHRHPAMYLYRDPRWRAQRYPVGRYWFW